MKVKRGLRSDKVRRCGNEHDKEDGFYGKGWDGGGVGVEMDCLWVSRTVSINSRGGPSKRWTWGSRGESLSTCVGRDPTQ